VSRDILAVDAGTTAFKLGVFSPSLEKRCEARRAYQVRVYGEGRADIDPECWWQALRECCAEVKNELGGVGVVSLSVTTPGLTPMDADGRALGPAMLFFDGRSAEQARAIRELVGEDRFLRETCNLPVTGGSSLCSILWIRENQPEIWNAADKFGHTNTYLVKRLTGRWAIDPSTTSITGLYNTAADDLTWNTEVLRAAAIPESKLPPLMRSHETAGRILPEVAAELGLPADAVVLCGGNDAVLAAFSAGLTEPGQIGSICGTCEITMVCLDSPVRSPDFNVRCHVVPGRWFSFLVLNTGGKALEWFHSVFCRDMTEEQFYREYVPAAMAGFLSSEEIGRREAALPEYAPFLGGSRYSLERKKAAFQGVTLETTREDLLVSLMRGNALYHGRHLAELRSMVELGSKIMVTGGAARIPGYLEAKRRWMGPFEYEFRDQSSLVGAAMLAQLAVR
jgi:sugar (pentulose or hexulose) kinase